MLRNTYCHFARAAQAEVSNPRHGLLRRLDGDGMMPARGTGRAMDGAIAQDKIDWMQAVLGVRLDGARGGSGAGGAAAPAVKTRPVDPGVAPPGGATLFDRPPSGAPITPAMPIGPAQQFHGAGGRALGIMRAQDGRVALTAPPPPVRAITFAGGGGKGAALPGAVRALQESGTLKDVTEVSGASVGSMTAALVAAGCSADEFAEFANDPRLAEGIKEGRSMVGALVHGGLTGEGMRGLMRAKLDDTLRKRITEYLEQTSQAGGQPDPGVLALLSRLSSNAAGPTFGDLRQLAKTIPTVKELSVSATYMCELDSKGEPVAQDKPQLVMFTASTEPALEVAIAVQASAALPPVFKPVDIKLSSGITARFQDGGVLNNVPSADSVGAKRDLDPMPESGSINFVFESEATREALQGKATPERSRLSDWISNAPNSAANYATYRGLAEKPEDIVMVPLVFSVPAKNAGDKAQTKDFSGLLSGTVNFDIAGDDRAKLQEMSETATLAHLAKRQEPATRVFDSNDQMLMSISRADLEGLAREGAEGAREALEFRDAALAIIARLSKLADAMSGKPAKEIAASKEVQDGVAELERLAGGVKEREGFVGREMNRSGALDRMIAAGNASGEVMQAAAAVQDALNARAQARTILQDALYPRLVKEDKGGVNATVLLQVEAKLRRAATTREVRAAVQVAIKHYAGKRDLLGVHGYKEFAAELGGYVK